MGFNSTAPLSREPPELSPAPHHSKLPFSQVMHKIWPAQLALFLTGTCGLLIFPFLTYVPSDGMLGDMLPKVRVCLLIYAHTHIIH